MLARTLSSRDPFDYSVGISDAVGRGRWRSRAVASGGSKARRYFYVKTSSALDLVWMSVVSHERDDYKEAERREKERIRSPLV